MQNNYPFEESDLPPLSGISNKGTKPVDNWIKADDKYTQRLKNELVDIVFETMLSIYKDAEDLTIDKTPENIEREFLTNLAEVKVWPLNIIKGETQAIMERCPMFAELLKAVFVSNVMVSCETTITYAKCDVLTFDIRSGTFFGSIEFAKCTKCKTSYSGNFVANNYAFGDVLTRPLGIGPPMS